MTKHYTFSPSSSHRWKYCAGSLKVNEPSDTFNVAALDGTRTHDLLEHCLNNSISPNTLLGQTITDEHGSFDVDVERVDRLNIAVDYVNQQVNDKGCLAIYTEMFLDSTAAFDTKELSGTADIVLFYLDGTIEIIDYKDGFNYVNVENNDQLEQYAICLISSMLTGSTDVTMTIIQPKNTLRHFEPVNSVTVDSETLTNKIPEIKQQVELALSDNAPRTPGDKQCEWCAAKGTCKQYAEFSLRKVNILFTHTGVSIDDIQNNFESLTDEQVLSVIEAAPLIRGWLEEVASSVQKRLENGERINGLKLVRTAGQRKLIIEEDALRSKLVKMGVPKGNTVVSKVLSANQIEKLIWTNKKGEVKRLSARQLKIINEECFKKSEGSVKVALDSDPLPEVESISSLFTNVED